ncbi:SDR family NAD(P)-dependent oxidoreductase [Rhodococcus ruber]|uniref:SDR family NAD(P)-dependent oxidoreductase n=1 Tax=Rhodococcus TaxID=1827 RepID=UPI00029B4D8D|nr:MULTISPECIES: SDR family oxidoreductase [Rhodococcus]ATQ29159.1 oxidoreductase [Rhodococcus ruber]AWH00597.1 KR domain-containing protein [Rhodococcus ruber]MCZ1074443.1 SDR family oxidoreductase [Rhodococcus sp. A5(2022)]QDC15997.1 SDR family oxidoreductase [Rhodococcus ruber]QRE82641.1 SDR family oxidoreductase [Rhodococcus ruber]
MMREPSEFRVPVPAESTIYIVGGTSGVGLEVARRFVRAGVQRIGLVGRNVERGEKAAQHIRTLAPGVWCLFAAADVNVPGEAVRVVTELADSLGAADILVNSTTGSFNPRLFHEMDPEDIPGVLLSQALGPINMCRAVLPAMRQQRGGVIVNIASDAAKHPTPGESVIGAAMAAIVMFSKTLAMEAKRDGIRVNAVTPSLIRDTGGFDRVMSEPFSAKLFEKASRLASLGVAEPGDVADLVLFLCSAQARRITGQVVSPNGGISAG